jgi:hypothetical protein
MEKIQDFVPDKTTICSALCALDSGYGLENDNANIDVIIVRLSRRKGNSILGR